MEIVTAGAQNGGSAAHYPSDYTAGLVEFAGRVSEVFYNAFGGLDGFVVTTATGAQVFRASEPAIGRLALRASKARCMVSVFAQNPGLKIEKLVVHC